MPRPKRKNTTLKKEPSFKKDELVNSTMMEMDSKSMDDNSYKRELWKSEVKDRFKDAFSKLNVLQKDSLDMLEHEFQNIIMGIDKNLLNKVIDIDNEEFRQIYLGVDADEQEIDSSTNFAPTIVRRRSKSTCTVKPIGRSQRLRSTSVDVYKTPEGRVRLSSVVSSKKYTVSKPKKPDNSGITFKRIMKPNEEAISTCGSPLYVASCSVGGPHVNIPLPGGVVLNIEPKEINETLELPGLDAKTISQIRILSEQLKKLTSMI